MKKATVFLIIACVIIAVTTITLGSNNIGEWEWESPDGDEVSRTALDSDYKLWSDAYTSATQSKTGHSVSASTTLGSFRDPWLAGQYALYATLNHDWVSDNNRDGDGDDEGEWEEYISRWTNADDKDWWASYDPSATIEYCIARGWISAKDTRTPSVRYGTNVYIPW